jgi:hypothetical protein
MHPAHAAMRRALDRRNNRCILATMSITRYIARLGGPAAAARLFCCSPQAISNWIRRRAIPRCRHLEAVRIAERAGFKCNPETMQ